MEPTKLWKSLSDENKSLVRKICVAAIALYVLLQLVTLFIPLAVAFLILFYSYQVLFGDKLKKL